MQVIYIAKNTASHQSDEFTENTEDYFS
jgi:hypothetical protein